MNRGARRNDVFLDDDDREHFLRLLAGMRKRFGARVISYCLMGNHFHLAVHCPEPSLSRSIQWMWSRYVRAFNEKHGFDGPLCKSRFHSVEITDDAQLLAVVRYIHRNPLDLRSSADLAGYHWSSHAAYLGLCPEPGWLDTDVPLGFFSGDREAFRRSVETALPFDSVKNRQSNMVLHDSSPRSAVSLIAEPTAVEIAVARAANVEMDALRTHEAGKPNRFRDAVLVIAADELILSADDLTEAYGFASTATFRSALTRARRRVASDSILAVFVKQAIAELADDQAA